MPGIGDYTASAILALHLINHNSIRWKYRKSFKKISLFKKENQIKKENLIKKKNFWNINRSSDYAQALMELGALICKPKILFVNNVQFQKL